jgi:PmbA protein
MIAAGTKGAGRYFCPLNETAREQEYLGQLADSLLNQARRAGAAQASVTLRSELHQDARARCGKVEYRQELRPRGLELSVWRNNQRGNARIAGLAPPLIDEALSRAMAMTQGARTDNSWTYCPGLPPASLMAIDMEDLCLWHPGHADLNHLAEQALAMDQAAGEMASSESGSEGASASFTACISLLANSHGFRGWHHSTIWLQHCLAVAGASGAMQRGWDWDRQCSQVELVPASQIGSQAALRAQSRVGARVATSGIMAVLFAPDAAVWLINDLVVAVSGQIIADGTSFLSGSLGKRIFPPMICIDEKPRLPRALESMNFDNEGVATRNMPLVVDGQLERYMLDFRSAKRLGMNSTGNAGGTRNLIVNPGAKSRDELVAGLHTGLLVTELMGHQSNPHTGEFSRVVNGFMIENGEIAYPVSGTTVTGRLSDMYQAIVALGNDIETRRCIQTPSILMDALSVAGSGR